MAYFPDWAGLTPEQLDFKVFDWIDFAFAIPSSSGSVGFQDEPSETKLFNDLVKAAHAANTKVKLSVGGWTGSKDFSKIVSSGQGRSSLAKSMLSLYRKYNLDGIDIDWEYPGQAGESSAFQKDDSANLLTFLQLLRKTLPSGAKISAAVQPTTFVGDDGQPMRDMSKFAKVLDWVTIMNYDVSLSSSTPGPNAPLGSCSSAKRPNANAKGGLRAWTSAGFRANQIVLGIASYGYISKSAAKELVIRNNPLTPDQGGKNMIMFKNLVKQGALTSDYKGAEGFTRLWDKCSSTPFLRSETAGQVVSYDDPQSIMLKGQFVKKSGMLGTNMWDMNGDTKDWALTNAARKGMGISPKSSSSNSQTSGGASGETGGTSGDTTSETGEDTNVNDGLADQGPNAGGYSTVESSSGAVHL
ncbi:glycoside hydrolase [Desarmillaria ectypa]|nr:glycoside hydrolase [Desarmillaria ectypa]